MIFKKFISRGNVIDLAVGVIIGGAFGNIVTSLVNDIIMPVIGIFLGGINFSEAKIIRHFPKLLTEKNNFSEKKSKISSKRI